MINFNFPKDFSFYRLIGVIAFPQGFWSIAIIRRIKLDEHKYQIASNSLLVWPDGKLEHIDIKFKTKSDNATYPERDNWIECVGNLQEFDKFKINYRKYEITDTSRDNYKPSQLGEITEIRGKFRGVFGSSSQGCCEPESAECTSGVVHANLIRTGNNNSNKILEGLLPKNPGIGFRRGEGQSVFINPDESKEWLCSCMSIDELTCLAVHETGGCILDNPV